MAFTVRAESGKRWAEEARGALAARTTAVSIGMTGTVLEWQALRDVVNSGVTGAEGELVVAEAAGFDLWSAGYALQGWSEKGGDVGSEEEWERGAPGRDRWVRMGAYAYGELVGRRMMAPREQRARSVFLAAVRRRPDFVDRGVGEFFKAYGKWLHAGGLPETYRFPETDRFDDPNYQRELELLEWDEAAYRRDLRRGKRFAVFMERGGGMAVEEGLLVEEPESVLFQEWAWNDREGSKGEDGFALAVALRPEATVVGADPRKGLRLRSLRDALQGEFRVSGQWVLGPSVPKHDPEVRLGDSRLGWWTIWGVGCVDGKRLEKVLREQCEGRMFEPAARWVEDANWGGRLWPEAEEEAKFPKVRYVRCKLDSRLGVKFHKAAFETVGRALWERVRPREDFRPGVPRDFGEHQQGDSGLVTVWSRDAFAVAYSTDGGKKLAENLKEPLQQLGEMRALAEELAKGKNGTPIPDEEEKEKKLFSGFSKLQTQMTEPGYRLLRRMFDATKQTAVHQAKLDVHLADEALKHSRATHAIERKLEFLELFIVVFYAYEFAHLMLHEPLKAASAATGWHGLEVVATVVTTAVAATLYYGARKYLIGDDGKKGDEGSQKGGEQAGVRDWLEKRIKWGVVLLLLLAVGLGVYAALHPKGHGDDDSKQRAEEGGRPSRSAFDEVRGDVKRLEGKVDELMKRLEERKAAVGEKVKKKAN